MSVDSVSTDMNIKTNSKSTDMDTKTKKEIKVVPWYNPAQFKKVYEFLYSSDIMKKRWAVDQISVWETRCHPSLQTAIEASLALSRAMIQDILYCNGATLCQEKDIQMMYSMALVRFVNLTIEVHQKYPTNLSTTAKQIGIPSWVVDLRNEATHSFAPSLPTLRMATQIAMKYLSDSFWEKEVSNLKNLEREHFDESEIRELLRRYILTQFRTLKCKHLKDEELMFYRQEDARECKDVLRKLAYYVNKYKREFVDILVSDGLFIPYDDELKSLMSPSESVQYDLDDETEDGTQISVPPVPAELEFLWRQLLNMLNMLHVMPLFLETLLKSQPDRSRMGKKLVISWARKILQIPTYGDSVLRNSLKKIFRRQGLTVNWHSMFHAAVSKPCLYTPFVFSMIYAHLDFDEEVTRHIMTLMAIYLGQAGWDSVDLKPDHTIYTVEDLKTLKKLQNSEKENDTEEGVWSVMQDPCYKSWPIGLIVNPVDDFDKTEDHLEDFMAIEYLDEKMDVPEDSFFNNKNDIEECFLENQPNISEEEYDEEDDDDYLDLDDLDLSDKGTFLYRIK